MSVSRLYAQTDEGNYWLFGIWAGWARNTAYQGGVTAPGNEDFAGNGPAAGLSVRYMPLFWLGVQLDPIYIQKNYGSKRNITGYTEYNDETSNHFFDAALLLHLGVPIFETGVRVFADIGPYAGYWLYSREKGTAETPSAGGVSYYDEKYVFQEKDNRFDFGLAFGGGVQYDLPIISFFLEWRMYYAFSDLRKKIFDENETPFELPLKMDTWTLYAGVLLNSNIFKR